MALGFLRSGGQSNYLNLPFALEQKDLIVVQITQQGGSVGTVSDGTNTYNLYASNSSSPAPIAASFYYIAKNRIEANTPITYSPGGTPTNVSIAVAIFKPNNGEKFGQPIVYTSSSTNSPTNSLSTNIGTVIGPAVLIGATAVNASSSYTVNQEFNGNSYWTGNYWDEIGGLGSAFKITQSNADETFTSNFNLTNSFQSVLNVPILLDLSVAGSGSNGNSFTTVLTSIFTGSTSNGSAVLTTINNISSKLNSQSDGYADPQVFTVDKLPIYSSSLAKSNGKELFNFQSVLNQSSISTVNGRIALSPIATLISPLMGQAQSGSAIVLNATSFSAKSTAFGVSGSYVDPQIFTFDLLSISATGIAKSNAKDLFNFQSGIYQTIISNSNSKELFNFKTNIIQSVNTIANGALTLNPISLSLTTSSFGKVGGYIDPQIFTFDPLNISAVGIAKSNAKELFNFQSVLPLSLLATSNNKELFNFKTNIIQSVNTISQGTAALDPTILSAKSFGFAKTNGYSDPQIFTIDLLNISATGIAKSNAKELFNFQSVLSSSIPTQSTGYQNILFNYILKTSTIDALSTGNLGSLYASLNTRSSLSALSNGYFDGLISSVINPSLTLSLFANSNGIEKFDLIRIIPAQFELTTAISRSSGVEIFNFKSILFQQIQSTSSANASVSLVVNPKFITRETSSNGFIDPLLNSIITLAPYSNAVASSNGKEFFNFQSALSSTIIANSNAKEFANFKSNVIQSINTTALLSEKVSLVQTFVIRAGAISDGYLDPLIFLSLNTTSGTAVAYSGGKETFALDKGFLLISNNISLSNGKELFNFKSNIVQSTQSVSNTIELFNFKSNLFLQANSQTNVYLNPLTLGILSFNAFANAAGKTGANLIIGITSNSQMDAIANINGKELFNFKSNLIQQTNAISNNILNSSFIFKISPLASEAISDGYSDPLLAPTNTLFVTSTGFAKINGIELFNFTPSFTQNIISSSNAKEFANFKSNIIQSSLTTTNGLSSISSNLVINKIAGYSSIGGYIDPTISNIFVINLSLFASSNSNGKENFDLIQSINPSVMQNSGLDGVLQDTSFELGSTVWNGINNPVLITNLYSYNGQNSFLVQNSPNTFEHDPIGPLGAYQNFNALVGKTYTLSAYVQNIFGSTPRTMYVQFVWSNGLITQSKQVLVGSGDGWLNISVSGTAPISGIASAYIVTSSPLDSLNGDLAVIDNVSLTVTDVATSNLPLNINAKTNAFIFPTFKFNLIQQAQSLVDGDSLIVLNSKISPLSANAFSMGYSDPLISGIASFTPIAKATAQSNATSIFNFVFSPYSNATANSNSKELFNFKTNIIQSTQSTSNLIELFNFKSNLFMQATAQVSAYLDPLVTSTLSSSLSLILIGKTGGIVKDTFLRNSFSSAITSYVNAISSGSIYLSPISQGITSKATATSQGYADPIISSIFNINLSLNAIALSGGKEYVNLVQTPIIISSQQNIDGNLLQNPSFEFIDSLWTGINNSLTYTNSAFQDGTQSLYIQALNTYDEYLTGPLGAKQDFNAVLGREYNLSAYVQNTYGNNPRDMYVLLYWGNGLISQGTIKQVATTDGWVQISAKGVAPVSGIATAFVVTSTPLDSLSGDIAVIDSVSLTVNNTLLIQAPNLNISAKTNGNVQTGFTNTISAQLEAVSGSNVITNIPAFTLAPMRLGAMSGAFAYINPNSIPLTLSLSARSYGRFDTSLVLIGFALSNAKELFSLNSRIIQSANTNAFGLITLNPISKPLSLTMSSRASGFVDPQIFTADLLNISSSAISSSNGKENFNFQSNITLPTLSIVNAKELFSLNSRIIQSANIAAIGVITLNPISLNILSSSFGKTGGYTDPQVFTLDPLNISASLIAKSNAKELFNFKSILYSAFFAISNTKEAFVLSSAITLTAQVKSNADSLVTISNQSIDLGSLKVSTKSNGTEAFSFIDVTITNQTINNIGNVIQDPSFELGGTYWFGLTNVTSLTNALSYDGSNSLLISPADYTEEDYLGIMGAKQNFTSIQGRIYSLSAKVQNISGTASRKMYASILWANNTISTSSIFYVSNTDGWVDINLNVQAPVSGFATLQIVTSDGFGVFAQDISAIDYVSLIVQDAPLLTTNLIATSGGKEKFNFQSVISQLAQGNSSAPVQNIRFNSILNSIVAQSTINGQISIIKVDSLNSIVGYGKSNGYSDPLISSIFIADLGYPVSSSSSNGRFNVGHVQSMTTPDVSSIIAQSSGNTGNLGIKNILQPVVAQAISSSYAAISIISNPIKAIAFELSYADSAFSLTFNPYANAMAISGGKEKFGLIEAVSPDGPINLLRNTSFEQDTAFWSGLTNAIYTTSLTSYNGSYSLLINDSETGLSGASQSFYAFAGSSYTLSAYVQNLAGIAPRNMYLQILWADGTSTLSNPTYISQSDGWVQISLTTHAGGFKSGIATAYIITSDGNSEAGDLSAIDQVLLTVDAQVVPYFETISTLGNKSYATSGGYIGVLRNINSVSNVGTVISLGTANPSFNSRIVNGLAQATADGYVDPTIQTIGGFTVSASTISKTYGNAFIQTVSSITANAYSQVFAREFIGASYVLDKTTGFVQSIANGKADVFNPGLIIPQFSKAYSVSGGTSSILTSFAPILSATTNVSLTISSSANYSLSGSLISYSSALGFKQISADPGIKILLSPSYGFAASFGNLIILPPSEVIDFIGWGMPI